jgi:hypothetical protein
VQIKVYTIDVKGPRWLVRALIFGAIPAMVLLGTLHYLRADVNVPNSFADDDTLSAKKMNDNLTTLEAGINSLSATVTALQGVVNQMVPAGTLAASFTSSPPTGWLFADGSLIDAQVMPQFA